jgi:hypothetical protein|tara:strand:+ start:1214 stop:1537 length:324 start_codon:yes stop_codon:yes gene_type:complete
MQLHGRLFPFPRMKSGLLPFLLLVAGIPFPSSADEFNPRQVVKAFPAITDPRIVTVGEAGRFVEGNELVLGVVIGEQARAYPINMLTNPTREIINDRLGGSAIAATW